MANEIDWIAFLSQAPVYVAAALAEELSLPVHHYYPTDMKQVVGNLPAGWVDWEGTTEEVPISDAFKDVTVPLDVTVVLEATDLASTAQRQRELMGAIKVWARDKKRLAVAEAGAAARLGVSGIDWIELSEIQGIEMFGKTIRVVSVSLALTVRDVR